MSISKTKKNARAMYSYLLLRSHIGNLCINSFAKVDILNNLGRGRYVLRIKQNAKVKQNNRLRLLKPPNLAEITRDILAVLKWDISLHHINSIAMWR